MASCMIFTASPHQLIVSMPSCCQPGCHAQTKVGGPCVPGVSAGHLVCAAAKDNCCSLSIPQRKSLWAGHCGQFHPDAQHFFVLQDAQSRCRRELQQSLFAGRSHAKLVYSHLPSYIQPWVLFALFSGCSRVMVDPSVQSLGLSCAADPYLLGTRGRQHQKVSGGPARQDDHLGLQSDLSGFGICVPLLDLRHMNCGTGCTPQAMQIRHLAMPSCCRLKPESACCTSLLFSA